MELVIGCYNVHKIREFREILKHLTHLDLLSLHNFSQYTPLKEEGSSFEEIAQKKAIHAALQLKKWVLADDSGLVVPALSGEPGILSRRYAAEDATDAENRRKLLDKMAHLKEFERSAYYECCLVLASPEGKIKKIVKGTCEGRILTEERGRNGFGYDSLFVKLDYGETPFAQLTENAKNRISHRRKALEKLFGILESLRK